MNINLSEEDYKLIIELLRPKLKESVLEEGGTVKDIKLFLLCERLDYEFANKDGVFDRESY